MTDHVIHDQHDHAHADGCGHTAVRHDDHVDYLHDGHLHHPHGDHVDDHELTADDVRPAACTGGDDDVEPGHTHHDDCEHETVPHAGHTDFLHSGHLHHPHGDHVDDHGELVTA